MPLTTDNDAKSIPASNLKKATEPILRCLLDDAELDNFDGLRRYIEQGKGIWPDVVFNKND